MGRTGGPVQEKEQQQLESDKLGERGALGRGVLSSLPESNLSVASTLNKTLCKGIMKRTKFFQIYMKRVLHESNRYLAYQLEKLSFVFVTQEDSNDVTAIIINKQNGPIQTEVNALLLHVHNWEWAPCMDTHGLYGYLKRSNIYIKFRYLYTDS